jgi:hypothetical protein
MVEYDSKIIHFGDKRYSQFRDSTPLKLYSYLDNNDKVRRTSYLKRAMGIKNKQGQLTYLLKSSANYYSLNYLW